MFASTTMHRFTRATLLSLIFILQSSPAVSEGDENHLWDFGCTYTAHYFASEPTHTPPLDTDSPLQNQNQRTAPRNGMESQTFSNSHETRMYYVDYESMIEKFGNETRLILQTIMPAFNGTFSGENLKVVTNVCFWAYVITCITVCIVVFLLLYLGGWMLGMILDFILNVIPVIFNLLSFIVTACVSCWVDKQLSLVRGDTLQRFGFVFISALLSLLFLLNIKMTISQCYKKLFGRKPLRLQWRPRPGPGQGARPG